MTVVNARRLAEAAIKPDTSDNHRQRGVFRARKQDGECELPISEQCEPQPAVKNRSISVTILIGIVEFHFGNW